MRREVLELPKPIAFNDDRTQLNNDRTIPEGFVAFGVLRLVEREPEQNRLRNRYCSQATLFAFCGVIYGNLASWLGIQRWPVIALGIVALYFLIQALRQPRRLPPDRLGELWGSGQMMAELRETEKRNLVASTLVRREHREIHSPEGRTLIVLKYSLAQEKSFEVWAREGLDQEAITDAIRPHLGALTSRTMQ